MDEHDTHRPVLLLDIDGVLNPYLADKVPQDYTRQLLTVRSVPYVVLLNPSHGKSLLSLGYDIIWATMWEDHANQLISPLVGLPSLPVIHFPNSYVISDYRLHLKTEIILNYMNNINRPYIWVDDEVSAYDRKFLQLKSLVPCDTLRIDPAVGLTSSDFERLSTSRMALEGHRSDSKSLADLPGMIPSPEASQGLTEAPRGFTDCADPTKVKRP